MPLPSNSSASNGSSHPPKDNVTRERSVRFCTLQILSEIGTIPAKLVVSDEFGQIVYIVNRKFNHYAQPVIEITHADESPAMKLVYARTSTRARPCRCVSSQEVVCISLCPGDERIASSWLLKNKKGHIYDLSSSLVTSNLILRADDGVSIAARYDFKSPTRVCWFSGRMISDLYSTALLSVMMLYYYRRPESSLGRFVRLLPPSLDQPGPINERSTSTTNTNHQSSSSNLNNEGSEHFSPDLLTQALEDLAIRTARADGHRWMTHQDYYSPEQDPKTS